MLHMRKKKTQIDALVHTELSINLQITQFVPHSHPRQSNTVQHNRWDRSIP